MTRSLRCERNAGTCRTSGLSASANAIGDLFIHTRDREEYRNVIDQISTVSRLDVQCAARKHLNAEQMIIVAVGYATHIEGARHKLKLGPIKIGNS